MAQHQATLRRSLRSALRHKVLADNLLDTIVSTQNAFNDALTKLQADSAIALDTDYESTQAVTELDFDTVAVGQHQQTMRKQMISSMAHRRMANEILDAIEEMEATHNSLMVKLDAEAGTLNDTDYASTLGITAIGSDSVGTEAQHKTAFRTSLKSAVKHSRLADQILDSISEVQEAMNAVLAELDAGTVGGGMTSTAVSVIDPDAA